MKSHYDGGQLQLPLGLGVVQQQRLIVPPQAIMALKTWRHACRLAWRLRSPRITQRTFAELTGAYPSHVSDYFCANPARRELPARLAGQACVVLGNTVLAQWLAQECRVTLMEELQHQAGRRAA